jgi:sulfite reductase alpha subunit-like flavoprotein
MLGQSAFGAANATTDGRIFVYEVKGLRQNEQTAQASFPVRNSSSTFIQVPYNRMNEEMRRIARLGGTIVSIKPLEAKVTTATSAAAAST